MRDSVASVLKNKNGTGPENGPPPPIANHAGKPCGTIACLGAPTSSNRHAWPNLQSVLTNLHPNTGAFGLPKLELIRSCASELEQWPPAAKAVESGSQGAEKVARPQISEPDTPVSAAWPSVAPPQRRMPPSPASALQRLPPPPAAASAPPPQPPSRSRSKTSPRGRGVVMNGWAQQGVAARPLLPPFAAARRRRGPRLAPEEPRRGRGGHRPWCDERSSSSSTRSQPFRQTARA